ncbi:MAG: AAA family ATPase [Gammaproteobacteria bacterium]|nr:AAA family ATPase [Gammaproteobacteria bacterium]
MRYLDRRGGADNPMYLDYFQLRCKPFELSPAPEFFYASATHRMALSMLEYSIATSADICLVTGEVGSGKTTLVQCLLNRVEEGIRVGVMGSTHHAFGDLLDLILAAFDVDGCEGSAAARHKRFLRFIESERGLGHRVVLVVDEAQNLSIDDLEAIRVLTNVNGAGRKCLQIILVGQPELRDKLKRRDLRQLVQRIPVDFDIKPLTNGDVGCYIRHRLMLSGGADSLFTRGAVEAISRISHGVPRVINLLCDLSLVYAYAEQHLQVSAAVVEDVMRDKSAEGLFWVSREHNRA